MRTQSSILPSLAAILLGALLGASPGLADVGPDSGKEGEKEKRLEPALDGPGGDLAERVRKIAEEGAANLAEIQKLLDEIQKSLADKNTGADTQGKQKEVLERMTKLLEELESQCSKCSNPSPSPRSEQTGAQPKQKKEDEEQQKSSEEKPREQTKSQAKQPQSEKERKDGKAENARTQEAPTPEAKAAALRDQLMQASRRWGLLPPKLRDEMLFSTGKEAPREYLEIIARYYKRMTEFYEESAARR